MLEQFSQRNGILERQHRLQGFVLVPEHLEQAAPAIAVPAEHIDVGAAPPRDRFGPERRPHVDEPASARAQRQRELLPSAQRAARLSVEWRRAKAGARRQVMNIRVCRRKAVVWRLMDRHGLTPLLIVLCAHRSAWAKLAAVDWRYLLLARPTAPLTNANDSRLHIVLPPVK
ncbi:protein of unknown function (plasmid) [Cupriavidus taiwanensis]|uniref:Uncharacterized protein n=1 Tax=Cupriavidus taiwanensis TaxID=164546 RepID=A0A375IKW4_9BURK|nr:protein of unknown function [Cupriavidus taiwanensis]